jgi:hypothetical protein
LLKHATRVTGPHDWAADERVTHHFWLTDNTILFFRFTSEAELWRYDVARKEETSLNRSLIEAEGGPYISPDGKWFVTAWPGSGWSAFELVDSNIAQSAKWAESQEVDGWLDAHHLIGIGTRQAYIYRIDDAVENDAVPPRAVRHRTVPLPRSSLLLSKAARDLDLHFVPPLRFLIHTNLHYNPKILHGATTTDIYAGQLDADVRHTKHYIFQAPAGYKIFDMVSSPDGTRVAWLLQSPTTGQVSLRVSRLDLSDMHELGTLPDVVDGNHGPWLFDRYSLQWVPNGQQLSFLYRKALWVVPVTYHRQ